MVKNILKNLTMCCLGVIFSASNAFSIFSQTNDDLSLLEDALNTEFDDERSDINEFLPMLIAKPIHIWEESKEDFTTKVVSLLKNTFKGKGTLIRCPDCDTYRMHVKEGGSLQINNGPLSLNDLSLIRKIPRYKNAKTVVFTKETPSGVVMEIVRIDDGVILFYQLADSSKNLDQVKPWFNYQREYERRKREESLSFVKFNLGFYLGSSMQFEFLEQWGSRNQHISGAAISLVGPTAALGVTYHYLIPSWKKLDLGGGIYFPLSNLALGDQTTSETVSGLAFQASATYLISDTIGISASTFFGKESGVSLGFAFYNPILLPFLL